MATDTKERPILFSSEMVKAIRDGRKSVTRRVIEPQPVGFMAGAPCSRIVRMRDGSVDDWACCPAPFGTNGIASTYPQLWVRESFYVDLLPWAEGGSLVGLTEEQQAEIKENVYYRADGECCDQIPECACAEVGKPRWRPGRFLPRYLSRITLEITDVRVERVQAISHHDALAEGVSYDVSKPDGAPLPRFRQLWDALNANRGLSWESDPHVWVIEFRPTTAGGN